MTQTASLLTRTGSIQVEMPSPDEPLIGGVRWGAFDVFPTPAYWHYQVVARRLVGAPVAYRLGRSLTEEVGACLLGGHGIPATVGLAAYDHLRAHGAFSGEAHSQDKLEAWLREPLKVAERQISYRFAAQKAKYLAAALPILRDAPTFSQGKALRDWLLQLAGVGPKTASWVARNWLDADDVAILDIHIMRVGQVINLFPRQFTVERHYFDLERLFLEFSAALGLRASEVDAVMWYEMASSPSVAKFVADQLQVAAVTLRQRREKEFSGQLAFA